MWRTFAKLGVSAFGGPAAHIAMLQEEAVRKNKWLSEEAFLSLNSLTNIIPGPNSSEMVLGVGYYVNGIKGLLVAGVSFMLPSIIIVLLVSMFFQSMIHHELVQVVLDGMKPVLFIMIAQVFIKFYKTGIKTKIEHGLLVLGFISLLLGLSELGLILVLASSYFIVFHTQKKAMSIEPISLSLIFTLFLKIGATLYGSGYVLLAYLENSFLKYMTHQDIVNAFLIGEITPGPVFTSATAIGVFLKGPLGGVIATLGIFIPSFILMMILMPVQQKVLKIDWVKFVLKGVNVASVALILKVLYSLSYDLINPGAILLLLSMLLIQTKFKVSQYVLLLIGPLMNVLLFLIFQI